MTTFLIIDTICYMFIYFKIKQNLRYSQLDSEAYEDRYQRIFVNFILFFGGLVFTIWIIYEDYIRGED